MGNPIVDTVYDYIVAELMTDYPDMNFYKYDPRAREYSRPFIGVQYISSDTTRVPTRTIGVNAKRHRLDVVIGVDADTAEDAEAELANLADRLMNLLKPWSYVGDLLVEDVSFSHQPESKDRLRDTGILRVNIISF